VQVGPRILAGVATIAHWDDLERKRAEIGPLCSYWTDLSTPAGSKTVRLNRIEVDPGKRSTPLHVENEEEEIFYVLRGSGLSWQREGKADVTYEVRAGDCLVHLGGEEAHTLVAGPDGLDVLAFGFGPAPVLTYFPRLQAMRVGPALLDVDRRHQWPLEAGLGDPDLPPPSARPARIVNVDDVEPEEEERGEFRDTFRQLGRAAGSVRTGLNHSVVGAGKLNCPPHCHSAEEELFVILDGEGTCLLGDEELPVRRGHVVAQPAGTRVSHAFRGGETALTLLLYGTREPNDIAYYPRSNKVYFRGIGLMARVERLDYWDGEAD
jgi:uncharacterized cupin superfamily protein